jgi:hypothetical protein
MTTVTQTRRVVSAFHAARTAGDLEAAAAHLAPAFTFRSPLMGIDDPADYLARHDAIQHMVIGLDMISELYGEGEATLVYDMRTATPAGTQRTAEHFKLTTGKISSILVIFDASPWRV